MWWRRWALCLFGMNGKPFNNFSKRSRFQAYPCNNAGIDLGDFSEERKGQIGAAIVDKDDLKLFVSALGETLQFALQSRVEFMNCILFIEAGNNNGINYAHIGKSSNLSVKRAIQTPGSIPVPEAGPVLRVGMLAVA